MSIEKDLQQSKPFKNNFDRAMVNLFFTSRFIESAMKKVYKAHNITMKQYNILRILRGAGAPMSTHDIGGRMIDRMSDISRIVDRMLDKQFVTKCTNNTDKRLVDISITEKGIRLLDELDIVLQKEPNMIKNLTEKEASILNDLLDKIRGHNI